MPVSKAEELKTFYRVIGNDERNTAVSKAQRKLNQRAFQPLRSEK